jgi:hypothetical protein
VNPLSGGVGPRAAEEAEAILSAYACETSVVTLEAGQFDAQIQTALDARPESGLGRDQRAGRDYRH